MEAVSKLPRGDPIKIRLLKFTDLLRDPRNPLRIPYYILKRKPEPEIKLDPDMKLRVSLTVDVEHDFGIPSTLGKLSTVEKGMTNLLKLFEKNSIEGTFFVSSPIVEEFSDLVKKAFRRHEIGVHGYNHECWSEPKWWLGDDRIIDRRQKEILLGKMIKLVKEITSDPPKSFRAPYMAANVETLSLLDKWGFEVDSSAPSYYGVFPKPFSPEGLSLKEVPVSANPRPEIHLSPFPHVYFNWLNTKLLSSLGPSACVDFVEEILGYQLEEGVDPHFVMLLHQWEFADLDDTPTRSSRYATENNSEILEKFLGELKDKFNVTFVSIRELANLVEEVSS